MHVLLALLVLTVPALSEMEPAQVDTYLRDVRLACPDFEARLLRVAHDALGTDYENGPLGEGPEGEFDRDPLIDLAHVDCVTYVEQTVALAATASYQEAFDLLQRIRYRSGRVDFESRNHFMVTDWLHNNPWCKEVTQALGTPTLEVTRTISKKDYFRRVDATDLGQDILDVVRTVPVIPPAGTSRALEGLTQPALIVFIGRIDWLFALHCGLYVPDGAGGGKLYHASSKAGSVVAEDLAAYMDRNASRYLGFAAYTIGEPEWGPPEGKQNEAE